MPETRKMQRPVSPTNTNDADDLPRGNCYGTDDPELFFSHEFEDQVAAALICSSCPLRNDCAAVALERREEYGIWGGMTKEDRTRALAPKPKAKNAPPIQVPHSRCRRDLHDLNETTVRYTARGSRYCAPCANTAKQIRRKAAAKAKELTA